MRYYNRTTAAQTLSLTSRKTKEVGVFRFPQAQWSEDIPLEFEASSQLLEARKLGRLVREKTKPLSSDERLEKATAPEVKPVPSLRSIPAAPVVVPAVAQADEDLDLFTDGTETE